MSTATDISNRIIDAALRLAADRPYAEIRLSDIAAEAGLPMAELAENVGSRMDVLRLFARRVDRLMLESLARDPVEGEPHDRLFEVLMRRLEVMTPWRAAVASILRAPVSSPAEAADLAAILMGTQGWILAAAGLEDTGVRDTVRRLGVASVYARTLRVWVNDDDPGLARTMAALDQHLRDGASAMKRLEPALLLGSAFASLARGLYRNARRPARAPESAKTASAPEEPPSAAATDNTNAASEAA
jgi:AcrR family transcriptional regulator